MYIEWRQCLSLQNTVFPFLTDVIDLDVRHLARHFVKFRFSGESSTTSIEVLTICTTSMNSATVNSLWELTSGLFLIERLPPSS